MFNHPLPYPLNDHYPVLNSPERTGHEIEFIRCAASLSSQEREYFPVKQAPIVRLNEGVKLISSLVSAL